MNHTCCEAQASWSPSVATRSWKSGRTCMTAIQKLGVGPSARSLEEAPEHRTQEYDTTALAAETQRIFGPPFANLLRYDSLEKLSCPSCLGHFVGFTS